jgi:hypothetical protein
MFENRSGSILPWEWRMPDRGHGIASRESQSASEKNSRDADIRSHGEQSCANPRRLEFCFRTDPESDQAYRALELEHLKFHRERDDVLY